MKAAKVIVLAAAVALAAHPRGARLSAPVEGALRVADMGMGSLGPQLGGSQDDMVLDDPGHVPREPDMMLDNPGRLPPEPDMVLDDPGRLPSEPNMVLDDPGRLPPEADMDIEQQQDLDRSDILP